MQADQRLNWTRSKALRFVLCLIVSSACLYLAARGISFEQVVQELRNSSLMPIVGAVFFLFLSLWIRAWRWGYLLSPVKVISSFRLFRSTMIGFMGNNLLPFRAGEVMRAVSIGQIEQVSKAAAFGSIVLERVFDGVVLALLPFLLLVVLDLPPWVLWVNLALLGVYVVGFFLLLALADGGGRQVWLRRVTGPMRYRLESISDNFVKGLKGITHAGALLPVSSLSLLCWFFQGMYYFLLFEALGLNLSIWAALLLLVVIAIGVLMPSAPGYVGNFQYFTVLGLALFGITQEAAFAYALLAHIVQFIPVTAVGLYFVFQTRLMLETTADAS